MTVLLVLIVLVALLVAALVGFSANTARRVEAAVPPLGQFMETDGGRIHYVDKGKATGNGPPIVMIHGLGANLRSYSYALADRLASDHRVILVDRPGAGYSTRAAGTSAALLTQAKALAQVIRGLGLKQPLLVGHSLGGALSLGIALDHPDCASALALIAPLTHAQDDVPAPFKGMVINSPLMRRIIAWTVAVPMSIRGGPQLLKIVFGPEAVPSDYPLRAGGLLGLRPTAFYNTSTDMLAANDDLQGMMARYGTLTLPIGVLYAPGDQVLDYRANGEAMTRKAPNVELTLVDGGHMLPITAPDACEAMIRSVEARISGKVASAGAAGG